MLEVSTIFWDLDGTLVNTNNLYDKAIKFACEKANCPLVNKIESLPNGQTLLSDFIFLTGLPTDNTHNLQLLKQLIDQANYYFKNNFNSDLIITKSLELFDYFNQLGLEQSIVSNSSQVLCKFVVNQIGIKNKCVYCFGIEQVKHGKPNPEPFLKALKDHKVDNAKCLVFEDSINGINSAKGANLTVISVGLEANAANPDYIWDINTESVSMILNKLSKSYKFPNTIRK